MWYDNDRRDGGIPKGHELKGIHGSVVLYDQPHEYCVIPITTWKEERKREDGIECGNVVITPVTPPPLPGHHFEHKSEMLGYMIYSYITLKPTEIPVKFCTKITNPCGKTVYAWKNQLKWLLGLNTLPSVPDQLGLGCEKKSTAFARGVGYKIDGLEWIIVSPPEIRNGKNWTVIMAKLETNKHKLEITNKVCSTQ